LLAPLKGVEYTYLILATNEIQNIVIERETRGGSFATCDCGLPVALGGDNLS
jgi:hypothetical protein